MKNTSKSGIKRPIIIRVALILAALVIVVLVFSYKNRLLTAHTSTDETKVHDLYVLESKIQVYYKQSNNNSPVSQEKLPNSLDQLEHTSLKGNIGDYKYKKLLQDDGSSDAFGYELCTNFKKAGSKNSELYVYKDYDDHKKGSNCFKIDAYQDNLFKSKYGNTTPNY